MKYFKPEDGLRLTTPIYMGSDEMVAKMQQCSHAEYVDMGEWVPHEELASVEMCMQQCVSCGATRAAVRGPEEHLRTAFQEGTEAEWISDEEDLDHD